METRTSLGDNNIFGLEEMAETRPEPQMGNHSGIFLRGMPDEGRNFNLARLCTKVLKPFGELGKQNLHSNIIKSRILDLCVA